MPSLSRTEVVAAARQVIARDGLDNLSMRRLARTLDVTPMALYRHVESRDDLVSAVIDAAVDQLAVADPALPLIDQLRGLDSQLRDAFGDVPELALLLIRRGPSTPRSVAFIEAVVAGFVAAGLPEDEAARTYAALTTLALARVAMPASPTLPGETYAGRPNATAAARHLSASTDTTVDVIMATGDSLRTMAD